LVNVHTTTQVFSRSYIKQSSRPLSLKPIHCKKIISFNPLEFECEYLILGVIKKIGKLIKLRKKITEPWKKLIKQIKILKNRLIRFYKLEKKKTEPNPNRKKSEKNRAKPRKTKPNRKNQVKPVFILKNRTESKPVGLNRFRFFFLNSVWLLFYIKTELNRK